MSCATDDSQTELYGALLGPKWCSYDRQSRIYASGQMEVTVTRCMNREDDGLKLSKQYTR